MTDTPTTDTTKDTIKIEPRPLTIFDIVRIKNAIAQDARQDDPDGKLGWVSNAELFGEEIEGVEHTPIPLDRERVAVLTRTASAGGGFTYTAYDQDGADAPTTIDMSDVPL